ncbi:MAG: aspartyl-phosphate phosphatase Spo0E family protein [Clostridia bacterium]|nr:aspartyl-phosphate phosphatase Spo0E family protein [Clostridia bacterium]
MIDEEILKLRQKLNESITNEKNYEKTYKLSVELDNLITQYYSKKLKIRISKRVCKK